MEVIVEDPRAAEALSRNCCCSTSGLWAARQDFVVSGLVALPLRTGGRSVRNIGGDLRKRRVQTGASVACVLVQESNRQQLVEEESCE